MRQIREYNFENSFYDYVRVHIQWYFNVWTIQQDAAHLKARLIIILFLDDPMKP